MREAERAALRGVTVDAVWVGRVADVLTVGDKLTVGGVLYRVRGGDPTSPEIVRRSLVQKDAGS
jgi:hypothetical protein